MRLHHADLLRLHAPEPVIFRRQPFVFGHQPGNFPFQFLHAVFPGKPHGGHHAAQYRVILRRPALLFFVRVFLFPAAVLFFPLRGRFLLAGLRSGRGNHFVAPAFLHGRFRVHPRFRI